MKPNPNIEGDPEYDAQEQGGWLDTAICFCIVMVIAAWCCIAGWFASRKGKP